MNILFFSYSSGRSLVDRGMDMSLCSFPLRQFYIICYRFQSLSRYLWHQTGFRLDFLWISEFLLFLFDPNNDSQSLDSFKKNWKLGLCRLIRFFFFFFKIYINLVSVPYWDMLLGSPCSSKKYWERECLKSTSFIRTLQSTLLFQVGALASEYFHLKRTTV